VVRKQRGRDEAGSPVTGGEQRPVSVRQAATPGSAETLPPGSDGWQNRLQERKDLADLLKVTSGAKDVITSSILVAGPLISSAFSLFLPGPPPG
jgi:hypothetical protein